MDKLRDDTRDEVENGTALDSAEPALAFRLLRRAKYVTQQTVGRRGC